MRITLVCMPWHSLDRPSLALGIIQQLARARPDPPTVSVLYGNLRWAECLRQNGFSLTDYFKISDFGIFLGMGDWAFSAALYGTAGWKADEYAGYLAAKGIDPRPIVAMQRLAPAFIDRLAGEILADAPDLVGFTTTFMQNVPSLALARRLKQARPELITLFGGGNCDGVMGSCLHRNFRDLDFVVRGEAEATFPALLDAIGGQGELASISGLCWREPDGLSISNPDRHEPCPIAQVPAPRFDTYFRELETSPLPDAIEPKLVLEAARGCWWGEKHQCTFCGLNGSLIAFRSKSPARMWQEITEAVQRYRTLDIVMVDNIIDLRYFGTLLPQLADADWDLKIHFEVKSNLTAEQVRTLKAARVSHVQPGIESLSSRVLRLMRKGVSGAQNVQLLRDGEVQNLTISWNYLYGFPGEESADYETILAQLPALVHLQPPQSATRIALERFSPHFDDPALGFAERRPADFYQYIYDLPETELADLAYLFGTPDAGIGENIAGKLQTATDTWRDLYPRSSLTYAERDEELVIHDRRANRPAAEYRLDDPVQVAAYRALRRRATLDGLRHRLTEFGYEVSPDRLAHFLRELKRLGLVFEDDGLYVALALPVRSTSKRLPAINGGETLGLRADASRLDALIAAWPAAADDNYSRVEVVGGWPDAEQLTALTNLGICQIDIIELVRLSDEAPRQSLDFLRFLRDAHAAGIHVRWHGEIGPGLPVRAISHLPPPTGGAALNPAVTAWREQFEPALFSWRAGPGFILLRDHRSGQPPRRQVLDETPLLTALQRLARPVRRADWSGDAASTEALATLLAQGIALQLSDWLLALPCRARTVPIAVRRQAPQAALTTPWGTDPARTKRGAGRQQRQAVRA